MLINFVCTERTFLEKTYGFMRLQNDFHEGDKEEINKRFC